MWAYLDVLGEGVKPKFSPTPLTDTQWDVFIIDGNTPIVILKRDLMDSLLESETMGFRLKQEGMSYCLVSSVSRHTTSGAELYTLISSPYMQMCLSQANVVVDIWS